MDDKLKIAVLVNCDFGTLLIRANYLHCLCEYLSDENVQITVFGNRSQYMNDAVFRGQPWFYACYPEDAWESFKVGGYDLRFILDIYPNIQGYNKKKARSSRKLKALVEAWQGLKKDPDNNMYFHRLRESKPYVYTKMINRNQTVLNSADIGDILRIGTDFRMPILTDRDLENTLDKFGLVGKKFITLHWEINPMLNITDSPKLWPVSHYEELIRLIHQKYDDIVFVQLGESEEHSKKLNGIDVSLLGKTDWDDLKILLKEAILHVDGESGMVHLRKALHAGPSVVLFGPTPMEFFGYEGNINLKSSGCVHWCAELRDDWEYRCIRGETKASCMYDLHPEYVFQEIQRYLNGEGSILG